MSAWWLIAPGALGCLAVLVTAVKLSAGKPKHAAPRGLPGPGASITLPPALPPAGSMILAEERAFNPSGWLRGLDDVLSSVAITNLSRNPDDPYDPDDDKSWSWREQTAADLAPEALDWPDSQVTTDGSAPGWLGADPFSCHPWPDSEPGEVMPHVPLAAIDQPAHSRGVSPGPGAALSSLTVPGPDSGTAMVAGEIPARPSRGHETAVPPTRLADTGDIRDARLLADVQAYLRAQDDNAAAYISANELGWHDFMQQYRAAFAEVLA